jgi:hypothetical protein
VFFGPHFPPDTINKIAQKRETAAFYPDPALHSAIEVIAEGQVDTLAHGLWGGAGFYASGRKKFAAAFLLGMAPDLLSFGVYFAAHPVWFIGRLLHGPSGPPPLSALPDYLFAAYNVTHSLVVWAFFFALFWAALRRFPWVGLAWGLHIVCDIPTHNMKFFPTPYLWPLRTPFFNGISWATPWFMAANYASLAAVYLAVLYYARRGRTAPRRAG